MKYGRLVLAFPLNEREEPSVPIEKLLHHMACSFNENALEGIMEGQLRVPKREGVDEHAHWTYKKCTRREARSPKKPSE